MVKRINFRKIVALYIIFFLAALFLSVGLLGYAYRNKLLFAYNYSRVSDKIEDGQLGVAAVKSDLRKLADESADIVDILILDDHNRITFSAKESEFSDAGTFSLTRAEEGDYRFLSYLKDPKVTFRLVKKEDLVLSTILLNREKQLQYNYRDISFYEDNISARKLYLLSYTVDKTTGDKIYYISDIRPVRKGPLYLNIVTAVLVFFLMLYWVLIALWVYRDAYKSRLNSLLWGMIALCTNIAGLLIYLVYKQNNQTCRHCQAIISKGYIYCTRCGAKLSKTCNHCNAFINKDDSFCGHCGERLTQEP
jgi:RNA polymerase subunit RPABC4/transcription elongation factor Spt4